MRSIDNSVGTTTDTAPSSTRMSAVRFLEDRMTSAMKPLPSSWHSIELQATRAIPEWDGEQANCRQEEEAYLDENGEPLQREGNTWACAQGHSFDVAKQGYVNLLPVQNKRSRDPGDSKAIVTARQHKEMSWVVGNNANLPVLPATIDWVLCLFGFPVYADFLRVLKAGARWSS